MFIVGAGASAEYGLPVGSALRDGVASDLDFRFKESGGHDLERGSWALLTAIRDAFGGDNHKWIARGRGLSRTVGLFDTVDEALHFVSGQSELVGIGKLAIAQRILGAERDGSLPPDVAASSQMNVASWLYQILMIALGGTRREEAAALFTHIAIINFNYDRTIEHGLYIALQGLANFEEPTARQALTGLRIIRPYGSLGSLPWQAASPSNLDGEADALPFGGPASSAQLLASSMRLRTLTEGQDPGRHDEIVAVLRDASVVVFLGFGFWPQNMELLRRPDRAKLGTVFATTLDVHSENVATISRSIETALKFDRTVVKAFDMKAGHLLRELKQSIVAAASL